MKYSAYVCCNCYRDGKTTEPPVPRGAIDIDAETGEVTLEFSAVFAGVAPGTAVYKDAYEAERFFDDWKESACPHPDMQAVEVYLGHMGWFEKALDLAGRDQFSTVLGAFRGFGHTIPPEAAERMLRELDQFAALPPFEREVEEPVLKRVEVPPGSHPLRFVTSKLRREPGTRTYRVDPSEFRREIDLLKKVCLASIETGNAIFCTG